MLWKNSMGILRAANTSLICAIGWLNTLTS